METARKMSLRKWLNKLELGNALLSVGTAGLMLLGVFEISFPVLVSLAGVFVIIVVLGKYIDEVEDDRERLEKYEELIKENIHTKGCDNS